MSRPYLTTLILLFSYLSIQAQTIVGKWKSFDDKTGELKSIVEIFEQGSKFYGKIIKTFPKPGADADPICTKCPTDDERFNKKIIGMEIVKGLTKDDDEYEDGSILDPEVGKIYRCKIWLEKEELKVRGYLGPFYRTQTWQRVP
ncbi:MAG: DUF2147 domain-containing protein [Cyclobacteriaceae bacterium]|jgi:uncharacterized protein (DUF2147 family)